MYICIYIYILSNTETAKRQNGETAKRRNGETAKRQNGKTAKRQNAKRETVKTDPTTILTKVYTTEIDTYPPINGYGI